MNSNRKSRAAWPQTQRRAKSHRAPVVGYIPCTSRYMRYLVGGVPSLEGRLCSKGVRFVGSKTYECRNASFTQKPTKGAVRVSHWLPSAQHSIALLDDKRARDAWRSIASVYITCTWDASRSGDAIRSPLIRGGRTYWTCSATVCNHVHSNGLSSSIREVDKMNVYEKI